MKGKTCSKLANRLNLYDLKKKLTPEFTLTLPWGYIHVYCHSSQTSLLYISRVSGEGLQDNWSSGSRFYQWYHCYQHMAANNADKIQHA